MPNILRSALFAMSVLLVAAGCESRSSPDPIYCGLGFYVTAEDVAILADEQKTDSSIVRIAYKDDIWVIYSGNGVRPPRYSNSERRPGEWIQKSEIAGIFSTTGFAFPMYVEIQPPGASVTSAKDLRAISEAVRPRTSLHDPCVTPKVERLR